MNEGWVLRMGKRIFQLGIIIVLLFFVLPAFAAPLELDMAGCVKTALQKNESVKAAHLNLQGRQYGIDSAKGAFGPAFSVDYSYTKLEDSPEMMGVRVGDSDLWRLKLNIMQPLFTGFALRSAYERAILEKEAAEQSLRLAELALIFKVQANFLGLLQARENVKSEDDSLRRLRSHLKVIQAFYDVGLRPKLDVLQAQVKVADAEQALLMAKTRVEVQKARLATLLNFPPHTEIMYIGGLKKPVFERGLEGCLQTAFEKRPDLRVAGKNVDLAQNAVQMVESDLYPHLAANLDYLRKGDDWGVGGSRYQKAGEWQFTVGLNWKFFEWKKTANARKQAKKVAHSLVSAFENQKKEVEYEVVANYLRIEEAFKRIGVAQKALEAAKESFRIATARYKSQVGTNTDVLDAQAMVTKSEAALTQALAEYSKSIAALYFSIGEKKLSL